jgi:hypothetical protein
MRDQVRTGEVIWRFPSTVSSGKEGTADFLQKQMNLYFHFEKYGKIKIHVYENKYPSQKAPNLHLELVE